MTQKNDAFNPFDPTGMFKTMRDSNMDAWSKMMIQLVNTEAYAQATAALLDAWPAGPPSQRVADTPRPAALTTPTRPPRAAAPRLAERLTNSEMGRDARDPRREGGRRAPRGAAGPTTSPRPAETKP